MSERNESSVGHRFVPSAFEPTIEQIAVQTSGQSTVIVEANAGAAKTTTLALRIAEALERGVHPSSILSLTYTPTACDAMAGALRKIGLPVRTVAALQIQTFDRFATAVLDEYMGSVPVLEDSEAIAPYIWRAVEQVAEAESPRWRDDLIVPNLGDAVFVQDFLRAHAMLKGSMKDLLQREGAVDPDYAAYLGVEYVQLKVYLAYERMRRRQFAEKPLFRLHSDATYDLARLLHDGEGVRDLESWPRGAKILAVDEMHDMNQAMFTVLAELLNSTRAYFCGVGDVDQVIHETAGADAKFMASAIEKVTSRSVVRLPLTHSFRFDRRLARLAGSLAGKPYSSLAQHSTTIQAMRYETAEHCAEQVLEVVRSWKGTPRTKMSELAILLRHGYLTVEIENMLLAASVPYEMRGFRSYLRRPEVLFVRGLLAIATDRLDTVTDPLVRDEIMRSLLLFTGSRIEVGGREAESHQDLLEEAISVVNGNPHLLRGLFFENQVLRNAVPDMRRRLERAVVAATQDTAVLPAMLRALDFPALIREAFATRERRAEAAGNLASLERAAVSFSGAGGFFEELNKREEKQRTLRNSASLILGSVVDVKGLEFDHVVLPFLEVGQFPTQGAPTRDERNKFYVGITRARKCLTLLASAQAPGPFGSVGLAS